jgi:long-chain-fatty-acid--CoA ligase ACSBG
MSATGLGANVKPDTLPNALKRAALARGEYTAMKVMRDKTELSWSWRQYYRDSIAFSKSIHALGVDERKAVNIMGFNSPEWAICY